MLQCFFRLILWFFLAGPLAAWALVLEPATGLHAPVKLSGNLAAHCLADDSATIEELARPDRASEFVALPELLIKGYSSDTCWLRFTLERATDAPPDWLLEVGMPYLDDVTLFLPSAGGGFASLQLGDRFPYAERPIPHRLLVFPFHLADSQPVTAYLRVKTTSTMMVETLHLWQRNGLLANTQIENAFYWLVFGLIALGVLSNLVFWVWLREGIYRSYTVYLVTLLVLNLANSGFATQWLWPQWPVLADRSIGFMAAFTFLVGLLFFDRVLELRQSFPRIGRVIPVILAIYATAALVAAAGHWAAVAPLVQFVALTATISITAAGPWLLWRGQKHLWLYVLAFSTQLLIVIAALSRNLGLWPLDVQLDHFILAATAIHVVLLNFALAERVRHAQRERHALEQAAIRLESEQLALEQQQEFMAMVAHEFRTPLAIIDTSAQRIAGQPQAESEKTSERCANIRAAVSRLTALMDEFLTRDRMEGQIRRFAPGSVRLEEILAAVLGGLQTQRIELRQHNVPSTVFCDPALLRVALANLLANALRFTPPGHPVRFSVEGLANGGVAFRVADDGPGIPADEQPRLFDKYFRGRNSQSTPGAGLGLFLVDQVAKLHGGTIQLASKTGSETSFTLTIPASP
ncbi:sensor histidine kinase [Azonexus hydrophilus]|uniref:sensor histidine kinase n=1 Tax=Azonexus hydrophilus TaxID=418702 RepID=UPI0004237F70|nr:sensor histidine kinase [Azonexus hydrophilus]